MSPATATRQPRSPAPLRAALARLVPVKVRRLFGTEAFFHGERMFAVLGADALVLRLHEPLRTEVLAAGTARPFLSEQLALLNGWVEVPYGADPATLSRLAEQAHGAAGRGRQPHRKKFRRAARRRA